MAAILRRSYFTRGYARNLPALRNGADFPACYLQPQHIQPISSYLKVVLRSY